MLNHIIIMGRLTRDPELRHTNNRIAVTSFTVAVERDFVAQGRDRETDFIDCVAWRHTGELVSKYFSKGRMIVVSGRLQIRDWTDKEGNKRRSAEIIADDVYFGDSKRDGSSKSTGPYASHNSGYPASQPDCSSPANPTYPTPSSNYVDEFAQIVGDDANFPF